MMRGIEIELRHHVHDPLWWSFFDFVFSASSLLLVIFFGAAIGNVVRGVPLDAHGYFFEPLWTNFRVGTNSGILDWYTLITGLLALVTLTIHGAHYIALKTEGDVHARSHRMALVVWWLLVLMTLLSLAATLYIRPQVLNNFRARPWGWIIPLAVIASLPMVRMFLRKKQFFAAFMTSTTYIAAMLGGAAFAMYPYLLPATTNPAFSLTIYNARTGAYSLSVGLIWWGLGITLAIGYFVFVYRSFAGKVRLDQEGY
jgi:cytochrome bd ubiquinol oxidase subunit II